MPSIDCSMRELNWFHRKKITWHSWHSPPTEASAIQLAEALSKQGTSLINRFGNWVQHIWNLCSRLLKSTWVLKYFHHAPNNSPHQLWPTLRILEPSVQEWQPTKLKKQIKTAVPTFQTLENQSNNFWYLSSYAKFVSYKNHSSWTVRNWRYANDVQYVRSKQVFIISKYIFRPL